MPGIVARSEISFLAVSLGICTASPVDKIDSPVETASSAASLESQIFTRNFVYRVLANVDCFRKGNVIVAR